MLEILGLILGAAKPLLDRLIPDVNARAQAQEELTKAVLDQKEDLDRLVFEAAKAQTDVNLKEAESPSMFVAGWRPFIGWVCGVGCAYGFIAQPFISWISAMLHGPVPPTLDMRTLIGLLGGLLGLGAMRTVETVQGVARQNMTSPTSARGK